MISDNQFVEFHTVDSYEDVVAFISESDKSFYSSSDNYKEEVYRIIDYKKEHLKAFKERKDGRSAYRNVFGYRLTIMLPFELDKIDYPTFVKTCMERISKKFKRLLYIYYFETKGKGKYAEIICFTRYVYKKPRSFKKTYNRDYYYDKETNKLCSKNNPNAVLKHKKGEIITDPEGKEESEKRYVQLTEEKIFKYKSFKKFVQKIKDKVKSVIEDMVNNWISRIVISRITIRSEDSEIIRINKSQRNKYINSINDIFKELLDKLHEKEVEENTYEDFMELIENIDELIYSKGLSFEKIKEIINSWWLKNIDIIA